MDVRRWRVIVPLTAIYEDSVIDATICSDAEFARVHRVRPRARLQCRECGASVHAKESKYGLRFFAHDRQANGCPSAGESAEHRALKHWIAGVVRRVGWAALPEASPRVGDHGGWRADLLAVLPDGARRVAFEVQLAAMTAIEGVERSEHYELDGIETVWMTTRHAPWLLAIPSVRAIEFDAEGPSDPKVDRGVVVMTSGWGGFENTHIPLDSFIEGYLRSEIVPRRLANYYEGYDYGGRRRSTYHSLAHVFMTTEHSAALDARERQVAEATRREQLHRDRIRELERRQTALLPYVVDEAVRHAVLGEVLSVGIQTAETRPRDWVPGEPAKGSEKTAFGIPVRLERADGLSRLFAVVCPVASRVSPGLAWSWIKRDVRVYVESEPEADRLEDAIGRRDIIWTIPKSPTTTIAG